MMSFHAFRNDHLDWRVDEGSETSLRAAVEMARAYMLLSDDKEERRKAQGFRTVILRALGAATAKAEGGAA